MQKNFKKAAASDSVAHEGFILKAFDTDTGINVTE